MDILVPPGRVFAPVPWGGVEVKIVRIRRLVSGSILGAILVLAACGEDPFIVRWVENPREALLFSLDRQEFNRPSGFEMLSGRRVVIESAGAGGAWDWALDRQDGEMFLLPPRVLGVTSTAAIVPIPGVSFEQVEEAPADTALYIMREPVPVRMGTTYVIRSHEQPGGFGQLCAFFGKVEPLEIDVEAGTLRFLFDTSPDCNNPRLVPPED
jgi:hypothetical protein